jgi:hypothetical protein
MKAASPEFETLGQRRQTRHVIPSKLAASMYSAQRTPHLLGCEEGYTLRIDIDERVLGAAKCITVCKE